MQCPLCKVNLLIADRNGIEIDYCPQCRGVWLDRGELDKIVERATQEYQSSAQAAGPCHEWVQPSQVPTPPQSHPQHPNQGYRDSRYQVHRYDDDDDYKYRGDDRNHKHRKRKNFLEEIFDFD